MRCLVCREREGNSTICRVCIRSYEKVGRRTWSFIEWTAERVRRYDAKRRKSERDVTAGGKP